MAVISSEARTARGWPYRRGASVEGYPQGCNLWGISSPLLGVYRTWVDGRGFRLIKVGSGPRRGRTFRQTASDRGPGGHGNARPSRHRAGGATLSVAGCLRGWPRVVRPPLIGAASRLQEASVVVS